MTAPKLRKKTFPSRFQKNTARKGCLGCSTWPGNFAFIFSLDLVCATAIVLPIALTNILGAPSSTASTTSTTTTTTSVCGVGCAKVPLSRSSRLAYYTFDSNLNDVTGVYPASGISSPTYTIGYTGSAISLDASSSQRLIASPMDLQNKSFTVQL